MVIVVVEDRQILFQRKALFLLYSGHLWHAWFSGLAFVNIIKV